MHWLQIDSNHSSKNKSGTYNGYANLCMPRNIVKHIYRALPENLT